MTEIIHTTLGDLRAMVLEDRDADPEMTAVVDAAAGPPDATEMRLQIDGNWVTCHLIYKDEKKDA